MIDPKKDPRRRCMPIDEWPERDRAAWEIAMREGGLLDERGPAAHWRPDTRKKVAASYGRYMTFLDTNGWLDPLAPPKAHMTPDLLQAYVTELEIQVAPVTLRGRIVDLAEAYRVMIPDAEFGYLRRAQRRLSARARPTRDKKRRVVPVHQLVKLGLKLLDGAEKGYFKRESWRAAQYRDGLIILLLACRPIRRRNLAEMRIGKELWKLDGTYTLSFEAAQMKGKRAHKRSLEPLLTSYFDCYLERYRPILLLETETDFVWLSTMKRPMAHGAIYDRVRKHTEAAFGHAVNLNLFRDCAMTSLADESPAHVWLSMAVLGHADTRIGEQAYNQACDTKAVDTYQELVCSNRHKLARESTHRRKPRQRHLRELS